MNKTGGEQAIQVLNHSKVYEKLINVQQTSAAQETSLSELLGSGPEILTKTFPKEPKPKKRVEQDEYLDYLDAKIIKTLKGDENEERYRMVPEVATLISTDYKNRYLYNMATEWAIYHLDRFFCKKTFITFLSFGKFLYLTHDCGVKSNMGFVRADGLFPYGKEEGFLDMFKLFLADVLQIFESRINIIIEPKEIIPEVSMTIEIWNKPHTGDGIFVSLRQPTSKEIENKDKNLKFISKPVPEEPLTYKKDGMTLLDTKKFREHSHFYIEFKDEKEWEEAKKKLAWKKKRKNIK